MCSRLKDALIKCGFQCSYLSSTHNESINPDSAQDWLAETEIEYCEKNVEWLHDYIIKNEIGIIINSCFSSDSAHLLDNARQGTNCKLITWIHNNVVELGSLTGFRREVTLRNKHLVFLYRLMTSRMVIMCLRRASRRRHQLTARACYERSDRIVAVCKGNIKEFLFLLGRDDSEQKVVSIPNFVTSLACDASTWEKEKNVVWCGTVGFDLKKTNWMLDIWRSIQDRFPEWHLMILGGGNQLEAVKLYASQNGVERVAFTGRVAPESYYGKAAILCSTSISESFGLTIIEGMQQGLVPVAFASSVALREVIGENGLLVKPFRKKQYALMLGRLMANQSLRDSLSEKCRFAAQQYEEGNVVGLWIDLFNSI